MNTLASSQPHPRRRSAAVECYLDLSCLVDTTNELGFIITAPGTEHLVGTPGTRYPVPMHIAATDFKS